MARRMTMSRYESPYNPALAPRNLEHVIYEKKGHVAHVTINRPEVRNALHSYAYAELRSCWRETPGSGTGTRMAAAWARRTGCTPRCRARRAPTLRYAMAA